MSRQYFSDLIIEPQLVANTLVTLPVTTDTIIFQAGQITIPALDVRPGKVWKLTAGGVLTTNAAGSCTITPRFGTLIGSPSLGASGAQQTPTFLSAVPWLLEFWCMCRTVGLPGVTATIIGFGKFSATGIVGTAGAAWHQTFGGTQASVDPVANVCGLQMSFNFSIAGSITPHMVLLQSLN